MFTVKILPFSFFLLFFSCSSPSDEQTDRPRIIGVEGDSIVYLGGEIRVRAVLDPAIPQGELRWRTGFAEVLGEGPVVNEDGLVEEDTLVLQWNRLPPASFDTLWQDSVKFSLDTIYVDTLSALNAAGESQLIRVRLENLTPMLDSFKLGPLVRPVEFQHFVLSAHRGAAQRFQLRVTDPYQKKYLPQFHFPDSSGIRLASSQDSVYTFEWTAPDSLFQDTLILELSDSRGGASRVYSIERFTYNESGALWIGARDDLVKVSSLGQEIFRISDPFVEISQIAIHPNRPFVWVLDRGRNQILRFHYSGERLQSDSSSFTQPSALTLDVQSDRLWVADLDSAKNGRMRRFDVTGFDSLGVEVTIDGLPGLVSSMDMDQFEPDILWFTLPESDRVGRVEDGVLSFIDSTSGYNRPHLISYDAGAGNAWVGDSSNIYVLDDTGVLQAKRSGFGFVSGLDAGPQGACVADGRLDEVVRFNQGLTGEGRNNDGRVKTGFDRPIGIALEQISGDCWIADRESGRLFKIDQEGTILLTVDGFVQPTVLAVHQGVE